MYYVMIKIVSDDEIVAHIVDGSPSIFVLKSEGFNLIGYAKDVNAAENILDEFINSIADNYLVEEISYQ